MPFGKLILCEYSSVAKSPMLGIIGRIDVRTWLFRAFSRCF